MSTSASFLTLAAISDREGTLAEFGINIPVLVL